ncbi:pyridoxamine 5'-phosphate oxidase family protein [Burkholderia lata]|uniref:Flavin-nucleotide-binding protein n=1 Tax=Burkholderia lata (strain ATCC 17760 / DSM 23089 / LMG 22485 / NCIMB 9086 / R18194 / 383) TaxID=482957 RepID=A0A6P2RGJ2_BURL3|nr:pyridoxamine 5'-phosphate oxidase family protein [Burkholderia lata]VWC32074.1 flavin-nucleotide-binding protein [Burkholderia lata]
MKDQTVISPTSRTTIRRLPELAHHDRAMLHRIVDAAYVCHIAFGAGEDTHCIPTAHWRRGDDLYIHGSNGSRMIKALSAGAQAAVAITLLDGLVLARSAFNHSMNYRSAVIYGRFDIVEGSGDKLVALDALMDKIAPGRKHDARPGNEKELNATSVLRIALAEVAVKVSDSMPSDKDEDLALAVWTGILPLKMTRGEPIHADGNMPVPDYVRNWAE